jgi:hypothetical protein
MREPERRIDEDDRDDRHDVAGLANDRGHDRGSDQHEHADVHELAQQQADGAAPASLREHVRAMLRQATACLFRRQPGICG